MKKKLVLGVLISAAIIAMAGCGKKEKAAAIEDKNEITYAKIYEYNKGTTLMDKYDVISYELESVSGEYDDAGKEIMSTETWTLFRQDGEFVITREADNGESVVYGEGTCYYENTAGDEPIYSYGWFMEGMYEQFISAKVDQFLVDAISDEDVENISENDKEYIVKTYIGEDGDEKYYYRYTMDKTSFELKKFEAVIEKTVDDKTTEQIVASSKVTYGGEAKMPEFVQKLKDVDKNRKITIHKVEDGEVKEDMVVEIPKNCTLMAALQDGYGLYLNEAATSDYDDTLSEIGSDGSYPDNECYLVYTGEVQY